MSFFGKKRIAREPTGLYIFITYLLAIIFTLVINPWYLYFPNFILLVYTWWTIRKPKYANLTLVFILGIFYDVICDRVMGVSVIEFLIVAYVVFYLRFRIQIYSFYQQTISITLLYLIALAIPFNLVGFFKNDPLNYLNYWSAFLSGVIWFPFVMIIVAPQYKPIKEETATHQNIR